MNHGLDKLEVPVGIAFDADFADLFEVRGTARERRGKRLESKVDGNSVVLGYEGLDHITRDITIQSDVRPERSSETGFEFAFSLRPKERFTLGLDFAAATRQTTHLSHTPTRLNRLDVKLNAAFRIFSANQQFKFPLQRLDCQIDL